MNFTRTLNEINPEYPQRYAKARGSYYAGALRVPPAAAAAASAALAR
jgi:hypothetical protein